VTAFDGRSPALIKKTPQQIIDTALDIAWFRQLQKELKP
jgi:hypothetical protein